MRRFPILLIAASVLFGQVEMETQLSMGAGGPAGNLVPMRTERFLYQDGALRSESGDWFALYRPTNGVARVYVVNSKERKMAEGAAAELLDSLRKSLPASLNGQFKISSGPATPVEPALLWQGKTVPGQACQLHVEMTGLGTPVTLEQTIETHTADLTGELAAAESMRSAIGLNVEKQMVMPGFPDADRITAALAPCFPQGRLLVRMDMTAQGKGLPVRTTVRYEVTRLRTGTRADAALFAPPAAGEGWTRMDLSAAHAAYSKVEPSKAALAEIAGPAAEPKSADLLKKLDELKRLVEAEEWEQARSLETEISMILYRRAQAAKPPPVRRLVELEARIAANKATEIEQEEAAELALQLSDLDKAARYARLMAAASRDDVAHSGHTLLGLLALRAGDKQQALAHLAGAGKRAGSLLVSSLGARMELAEKLAEDGEYVPVTQYLEACRRGSRVRPETARMYERAIEALHAKTKPYFTHSFRRFELPAR